MRNLPSRSLTLAMMDFQIDTNAELIRLGADNAGEDGGLLTKAELEVMLISFSESRTPEWTAAMLLAYRVQEDVHA